MLLVEELAARGWPAAESMRAEGWLLRHTPSLTRRRSNSALPVGGGDPDPALVEDFYARRGARALVQVSPTEAWMSLDAALAADGWSSEGPTDVLVADSATLLSRATPGDVTLTARPGARWVAAWAACEERPDADVHAREVLARIEPPTAYALAEDGAGVGLVVCERGWAGLFCMATAVSARRRGIARTVVHALTGWAAQRGAQRIYLQVESDNAPAHALYANAGFERSHGYHYRVAPRAV